MYQIIPVADVNELIAKENPYIFDTRDINAFQASHIKGAKHLSRENIAKVCEELNKDRAVLVYCYLGISSQNVAQFLAQEGFTKVYSLEGGFDAWQKQNPTS